MKFTLVKILDTIKKTGVGVSPCGILAKVLYHSLQESKF